MQTLPGDLAEAILGQEAAPETVAAFGPQLGLDVPAHLRYIDWLGDILSGDLGSSLANGRDIVESVGGGFATTIFLDFLLR